MSTGPDKPMLDGRETPYRYSPEGADGFTVERLAAALGGRYDIQKLIGRGGASYVYLARDRVGDRTVALKVLRPDFLSGSVEARFHREIEIARRLQHPNILTLLDSGSVAGLVYFTMPYVEGDTLRARLRRERQLSLDEAIRIARDIANALDYAHEKGIVHRDIKPPNILLDNGWTLVADFGIARAMTVVSGEQVTTHSGLAIGTPEYMSPEQGSGHRDLDARCDIYALGCVFYEMLAGEPPFTGPTAQAVIARHCLQPLPSIRVIRPEIPVGVEKAIGKALAKVAVDRFPTATGFLDAIEQGATADLATPPSWISSRARIVVAVAVVAAAALAAVYAFGPDGPPLDPNRVVVFPLHDQTAPGASNGEGEAVATYVGYALDGTRPLKWMDGWDLIDGSSRERATRLDSRAARRISRSAGAGFFIDGSIMRRPDSITVILKLFSLEGDSVVRVVGRSAPIATASAPQLGVAAVTELLPALLAPGRQVNLAEFGERKPTAVANFLQGEREYRRMQFKLALQHYQAALNTDSAFTLAASRGAYAANWMSDLTTGSALARKALRPAQSLSAAQVLLNQGLNAYLTGSADSAVRYLRQAISSDSLIHAGWTLLGEVYSRLLPNVASPDSLARHALSRARRADSDFAPTLLLLEEAALRDGNIDEALVLREELRKAGADTTHQLSREMMLSCVRDGAASVDWNAALVKDEMAVLSAGKLLAGAAAQPRCTVAIFRAVVHSPTATLNARWAAFLGLQAQLAATNQRAMAAAEFSRKEIADLPRPRAYLLMSAAGAGFEHEAASVADSVAREYHRASATALWFLGTWEAHRKNLPRVREIAEVLQRKADSSGLRRDQLIRDAIAARLTLVEGDSAGALKMLRALTPTGTRVELAWQPWESLGAERMELAKLLFARDSLQAALAVASQLDAAEPVIYPLYVRPSLVLRLRIAERLGQPRLAREYRRRLAQTLTDT
jgi:serine/threonine-protein kinase